MAASQGIYLPLGPTWSSSPAWTSLALNSSTRKVSGIMQIPGGSAAQTITRLACRTGTITGTSPVYRISLQGVDALGLPDGVIKGGGLPVIKTFTPATANAVILLTLDNSYAGAPGEWVSVVVDYSSGIVDATNHAQFGYTIGSSLDCGLQPYGMDFQAAWTKRNEAGPFGLGTAGELWGEGLFDSVATLTFANASSPNEYGMAFAVPAYFGSIGLRGLISAVSGPTTGGTSTLSLYAGSGAADTTLLASVVIYHDMLQGNRRQPLLFDDPTLPVLTGGASYRIALRADGTQTIAVYYQAVNSAAHWDAGPLLQNARYTTRAGGTWTDTATRKMPWELILSDVTGGGGSSRPQHPLTQQVIA